MAGEKKDITRKSSRITALSRANDGGSVSSYTGKKDEDKTKAEQEAVNAAKVAKEKAAAEAARKAGAEAAKKKKLSAADIAMGRR